jgi:hypothetical protein
MAIRNNVADEMKIEPPAQSTRVNFSPIVAVRGLRVRSMGMVMRPKAQKGNIYHVPKSVLA